MCANFHSLHSLVLPRYMAALGQIAAQDEKVAQLFGEVFQLMRPLSALWEEPLASRVNELLTEQAAD